MKLKIRTLVIIILFLLPGLSFVSKNDQDNPIKPGAMLEKLAGGFSFTEGPAADAKGNVYFTDQPNDRIMIWTTKGELITFMKPCGRSNGLCFDRKGNLWACADEKNELWQISPDKKVTVVLGQFSGKLLNGPNDLWTTPDGGGLSYRSILPEIVVGSFHNATGKTVCLFPETRSQYNN